MTLFQLCALALAVFGGVGMNLMMKYLSHLPSMPMLLLSFLIAFFVGGIYFFLTDGVIPSIEHRDWWFVFGLGLAFLIINIGFMFLYQRGFSVSFIPLVTTGLQIFILTVRGFLFFGQTVSWTMIAGMVCVLVGIGLMTIS